MGNTENEATILSSLIIITSKRCILTGVETENNTQILFVTNINNIVYFTIIFLKSLNKISQDQTFFIPFIHTRCPQFNKRCTFI